MELKKGFYDFYWDNANGKIYLVVDKLNTPFLYDNNPLLGVGIQRVLSLVSYKSDCMLSVLNRGTDLEL